MGSRNDDFLLQTSVGAYGTTGLAPLLLVLSLIVVGRELRAAISLARDEVIALTPQAPRQAP